MDRVLRAERRRRLLHRAFHDARNLGAVQRLDRVRPDRSAVRHRARYPHGREGAGSSDDGEPLGRGARGLRAITSSSFGRDGTERRSRRSRRRGGQPRGAPSARRRRAVGAEFERRIRARGRARRLLGRRPNGRHRAADVAGHARAAGVRWRHRIGRRLDAGAQPHRVARARRRAPAGSERSRTRAALVLYTSGSTGVPKEAGRRLVNIESELGALESGVRRKSRHRRACSRPSLIGTSTACCSESCGRCSSGGRSRPSIANIPSSCWARSAAATC